MKEKMEEKEIKLANRWMRFWLNLVDIFFVFTIIGGIANMILWLTKGTTLGHLITGVKVRSISGKPLINRQKRVRGLTYYPIFLCFFAYAGLVIYLLGGEELISFLSLIFMVLNGIMGIWNIIEIFGPSPNLIEGIVGTRRVQDKEPITWLIMIIVLLFLFIVRLLGNVS